MIADPELHPAVPDSTVPWGGCQRSQRENTPSLTPGGIRNSREGVEGKGSFMSTPSRLGN